MGSAGGNNVQSTRFNGDNGRVKGEEINGILDFASYNSCSYSLHS